MSLHQPEARYALRHPHVLEADLFAELLDPALVAALGGGAGGRELQLQRLRGLARHEFEDAYSVPLLSPSACALFREEAESFRDWTAAMGRSSPGLLLSARWYFEQMDPRYRAFFDRLLTEVLRPLDEALVEVVGERAPLAYHHDYCICYRADADRSLKPHTDDSDVTFNIFLGAAPMTGGHQGAELVVLAPTEEDVRCGTPRLDEAFGGTMFRYAHAEVGRAAVHLGDRWHSVEPLTAGSRWNLLIWAMRSDCEWKAMFYEDLARHLQDKASRA